MSLCDEKSLENVHAPPMCMTNTFHLQEIHFHFYDMLFGDVLGASMGEIVR